MAPIVRILLRVIGGFLIGYGYSESSVNDVVTDPELVGLICLLASEAWYYVAIKMGWTT